MNTIESRNLLPCVQAIPNPHTTHNTSNRDLEPDTTIMEAFTPTSSSPSHYSSQAIGFLIGAGAVVLIIIIFWVYIAHQDGPSQMLRSYRERKEATRKARDIELAEGAANSDRVSKNEPFDKQRDSEQIATRQEALDQLNGLYQANKLVGSTLPSRPQQVNFDEERVEEQREEERLCRVQKGEQLRAMALKHEQEGRRMREEFLGRDRPHARDKKVFVVSKVAGKPKATADSCLPKDSLDLTIDPMSRTWGNGRAMAKMYR